MAIALLPTEFAPIFQIMPRAARGSRRSSRGSVDKKKQSIGPIIDVCRTNINKEVVKRLVAFPAPSIFVYGLDFVNSSDQLLEDIFVSFCHSLVEGLLLSYAKLKQHVLTMSQPMMLMSTLQAQDTEGAPYLQTDKDRKNYLLQDGSFL